MLHLRVFIQHLLLLGILAGSASIAMAESSEEEAAEQYSSGQFQQAERLYLQIEKRNPRSATAVTRLGQIALISNRFSEAEKYLTRAAQLQPENQAPIRFLAELYYRQLKFEKAAPLLRKTGRESMARKLESFAGQKPYDMPRSYQKVRVQFVHTDPLPLIELRVNGGAAANFLIDTGGAEIVIDDTFARDVGITTFGGEQGVFAGGKQAGFEHARVDSITLGNLTVRNIPAIIQNTRRYAPAARGKRVDGILGTVFLSQFLSTIDYAAGALELRPRGAKLTSAEITAPSIPFWMISDHLMVSHGTLNRQPVLLFIDTGLAGMGITAPRATLELARIRLDQPSSEGIGGGGKVSISPFETEELSLGPVSQKDIAGLFGPFPPQLERVDGVRIGGLISHQFFRPYALTLDFRRMELRLKQPPTRVESGNENGRKSK